MSDWGSTIKQHVGRFRNNLTENQRNKFDEVDYYNTRATLQDLELRLRTDNEPQWSKFDEVDRYNATATLEELELSLRPENKQQWSMNRTQIFLNRMKILEESIGSMSQVEGIGGCIWGPIKSALLTATLNFKTFCILTTAYEGIGDLLSGLKNYVSLCGTFQRTPELVERILSEILDFNALNAEIWSDKDRDWEPGEVQLIYDIKLHPIVENLKQHKTLLEEIIGEDSMKELSRGMVIQGPQGKGFPLLADGITKLLEQPLTNATAQAAENTYSRLETDGNTIQEADHNHKWALIKLKLNPGRYISDQLHARNKQLVDKTGDWIIQDPVFKTWYMGDQHSQPILYLHGIPGSGKTVLTARVIHFLEMEQDIDGTLLYYSFDRSPQAPYGGHDEYKDKSTMLRAFLHQIAYQGFPEYTLLDYIYRRVGNLPALTVQREDFLEGVVDYCIKYLAQSSRVWVILDGIDKLGDRKKQSYEESRRIVEWVENLGELDPNGLNNSIRIMISARRDGFIDDQYSEYPSIDLGSSHHHQEDIESFIEAKISGCSDSYYRLLSNDELESKNFIMKHTNGMFSYAKILLDNLEITASLSSLEKEIENPGVVASRDLAFVYENACIRVFDRAEPEVKELAISIIAWIITAGRPLRWREIQTRLCLNVDQENCDPGRRAKQSCKAICGSLVDIIPLDRGPKGEQIVSIVHETASRYLFQSGRFQYFEEHTRTLDFCSRYLFSRPFSLHLDESLVTKIALTGYYGLLDYCLAYWSHHAEAILQKSPPKSDTTVGIIQNVRKLLSTYNPDPHDIYSLSRLVNTTISLLTDGEEHGLLNNVRAHMEQSILWSHTTPRFAAIRGIIEKIDLEAYDIATKQTFEEMYGDRRFKCANLWCQRHSNGCLTARERMHACICMSGVWPHNLDSYGEMDDADGESVTDSEMNHSYVYESQRRRPTCGIPNNSGSSVDRSQHRNIPPTSRSLEGSGPTDHTDQKAFISEDIHDKISVHRMEVGINHLHISGGTMIQIPLMRKRLDKPTSEHHNQEVLPSRTSETTLVPPDDKAPSTDLEEVARKDLSPMGTQSQSPLETETQSYDPSIPQKGLPAGETSQLQISSSAPSETNMIPTKDSVYNDLEHFAMSDDHASDMESQVSDIPLAEATPSTFAIIRDESKHASNLHHFVNNIKLEIEYILGLRISFWPLEEPLEPCLPGYRRYFYDCECGIEMTLDLPETLNATTDGSSRSISTVIESYHLPRTVKLFLFALILIFLPIVLFVAQIIHEILGLYHQFVRCIAETRGHIAPRPTSMTPPTTSHEAPSTTPDESYSMPSLLRNAASFLIGYLRSSDTIQKALPPTTSSPAQSNQYDPLHTRIVQQPYAFWCVKRDNLHEILKQIPMYEWTTTGDFFETLRSTYTEFRGVRRFFSLNYICNIQYVSFHLIEPSSEIGDGLCDSFRQGLPCGVEQHLYSEPWSTSSSPFLPAGRREMMKHFHKIGKSSPEKHFIYYKLPKKYDGRLESRDAIGFGLQAVEGPSPFKVIMTIAAIFLIPTAILVPCWLEKYPGDLQNAFTIPTYLATSYFVIFVIPGIYLQMNTTPD